MKKVLFSFLATAMITSASFASTPPSKKEGKEKKETKTEKTAVCVEEKIEEEVICSAECSVTFADGTTISATAGNWFMSCERAAIRCFEKLGAKVDALE